jgi:hypothetical protein
MSRFFPGAIRPRRRLILVLGLYLLLPVTLSPLKCNTSARSLAVTLASSPSPTPEPSPPVVDFQAIPDRESIGPDDNVKVALFIANKSSKPLTKFKLNLSDPNFEITANASLPASLPAFGSITNKLVIKPTASSTAGTHKLLFSIEYAWNAYGTEFVSAQPTTATVSIARRFEEESKGFPGGTAAFFYLLLPIIPAILSYQFFEGLRKGEGPKLPQFKAEYIVPAFLVAVMLSLLMLVAFKLDRGLNYSNPLVFMGVLFGSLVAGALVPNIRWLSDRRRRKLWAFTPSDSLETYLRKALLAPWSTHEFKWARGSVDNEEWTGIHLSQPDGATVLGATLQVSYPKKASPDQWNALLQIVDEQGVLLNYKRLVEMVEAQQLKLDFDTRITHDGNPIDEVVVIDDVKNWKRAGADPSPLVRPFR